MIRKGFRRLLKAACILLVALPPLLMLLWSLDYQVFPNGVVMERRFAWDDGWVADLRAPSGKLVARNVSWLCWNETAISGDGKEGGFLWSKDRSVMADSDPQFMQAHEAAGLGRFWTTCGGFHRPRLDAETMFRHRRPMWPGPLEPGRP